ncbi:hypothetical protein CLD22_16135 [Rubrivivax gelatinosus]|nr:hypothetical protein [Rubrivivax gelatinosus]
MPTQADSAAYVLREALGADVPLAAALEELKGRVDALRDPLSPEALETLQQHLPVIDALFKRYATDSIKTRIPDRQALLARVALQAQQAYSRSFALLHGLELQRRGAGRVLLTDDDLADQ